MDYIKKILPYALAVLAGAWVGFYIGTQYYPRVETKTVTNTIEKPVYIKGEATTVKETEIAYVPKETVIVKYIDAATGQEVTGTTKEKTDLEANIGKTDFTVKLNGKEMPFKKADDEEYLFDKYKLALTQSSKVTFDVHVDPIYIDETRRWSIGVGYGSNGIAYKVDFPIGSNEYFGGWVYKDDQSKTVGVEIKF